MQFANLMHFVSFINFANFFTFENVVNFIVSEKTLKFGNIVDFSHFAKRYGFVIYLKIFGEFIKFVKLKNWKISRQSKIWQNLEILAQNWTSLHCVSKICPISRKSYKILTNLEMLEILKFCSNSEFFIFYVLNRNRIRKHISI